MEGSQGPQVRETKRQRPFEGLFDVKITQTTELELLRKEVWDLKREVIRLENLMRGQYQDLGGKIENFFNWSTQCLCSQNQRSIDCQNRVYFALLEVTKALNLKGHRIPRAEPEAPRTGPDAPSTSQKPPQT